MKRFGAVGDASTPCLQVLKLLAAGEAHRHFGETKMNVNSSRSHTLFRMVRRTRRQAPDACALATACQSRHAQAPSVWRRRMQR